MRSLLIGLLLLGFGLTANAQSVISPYPGHRYVKAWNFKTITTFVDASDDTTGFVSIGQLGSLLLGREVGIIAVSNDSAALDIYCIGRNNVLTSVVDVFRDSLVSTSNTGGSKVIMLKDATVNRLEGMHDLKVGSVFRASGNGTTAGRTYKLYLFWND